MDLDLHEALLHAQLGDGFLLNEWCKEKEQELDNPLKQLDDLVQKLGEVRTGIAEQEANLKCMKDKEKDLVEVQIPTLMQAHGQEYLRTTSGFEVDLKEQVFARIPADKKEAAHQWLRDNNEGGMIKTEVKEAVHPQTLKCWVRGKLDEGATLPEDLFSIYVRKVAKVT